MVNIKKNMKFGNVIVVNTQFLILEKKTDYEIHCSYITIHTGATFGHITYVDNRTGVSYHYGYKVQDLDSGIQLWSSNRATVPITIANLMIRKYFLCQEAAYPNWYIN